MTEPQVMDEAMLRKQEEQKLREQSKALIAALTEKNVASLKRGEGRLGYEIGTGDDTVFILAAPIMEDVPHENYDRTRTIVERVAHYIMVTPLGIREMPFVLGQVIDDNHVDDKGGHYNGGEHGSQAFTAALEEHAKLFEDAYGMKKPTAANEMSYKDVMNYYGWQKDEKEHEVFTLPKNLFRASTSSQNLKTVVDPDLLPRALQASKQLAAKPHNATVPTPAALQTTAVISAMNML